MNHSSTVTRYLFRSVYCCGLAFLLSACDSNTLEPADADEASTQTLTQPPAPQQVMHTIEYAVWSEKGRDASVDMLMWVPVQEQFIFKTVQVDVQGYEHTFEVTTEMIDALDFTVYSKAPDRLIRASISVNGEMIVFATASEDEPLVSLDIRG